MTPIQVLQDLTRQCHQNALDHGFWSEGRTNVGEKVALIHTELSEFFERYRKDSKGEPGDPTPDEHCPQFSNQEIELADTIIRILDLSGHLQMDLAGAILAKMEYNKTRPHLHGKAF